MWGDISLVIPFVPLVIPDSPVEETKNEISLNEINLSSNPDQDDLKFW